MNAARHHVIVGTGVAGNQAARTLRRREPDARITLLTLSALPFYNRYDLPRVFRGHDDWRDFLVDPPSYYDDQHIGLRRRVQVVNVDARRKTVALAHNEELSYDTLLVATGGRGYLPEELSEFRPLLDGFATYEQAMAMRRKVPEGGTVAILGGDMIGLDLARTLVDTGHRVVVVAGPLTFWPHVESAAHRAELLQVLQRMGIEIIDAVAEGGIDAIQAGARGFAARRIAFGSGRECAADVVLPSFGLVPSVEFLLGSGIDLERGVLVSRKLRTTDAAILAAGDVCQIWSEAEKRYRFYYGWKNVRAMGELAARNLTGDDDEFEPQQDETLHIHDGSTIHSPFWEYA
ncbi:MAG TPA: FAD/NAD(P)-binding oxidoreductase [Burkholderiaceae bacterium]|nr:FAD/NAD(P)-binding oxidoreductase [Burkholderiaceae bacterium]